MPVTRPRRYPPCHVGGQILDAATAVKMPPTQAHVTSTECVRP
jgi:hypothetical protein